MKRIYLTPETFQVSYYGQIVMGAASPDSGRESGGDPTGNGLGIGIDDYTGDDDDPLQHGQGDGGAGNRSKGGGLWDWD